MRVSLRAADVRVLIGHARRNQLETKKKKRNPLITQNDSESNQENI